MRKKAVRKFWISLTILAGLSACAPLQSGAELQAEIERDLHETRLHRQHMLQDYEQHRLFPAPDDLAAPSPRPIPQDPVSVMPESQPGPNIPLPRARQSFPDPLLPDPVQSGSIVEPLGSRQPPPAPLSPHYEIRSPATQEQYQQQQNQRRDQVDRDFDARREWQQRRDLPRR